MYSFDFCLEDEPRIECSAGRDALPLGDAPTFA